MSLIRRSLQPMDEKRFEEKSLVLATKFFVNMQYKQPIFLVVATKFLAMKTEHLATRIKSVAAKSQFLFL